MHRQARPSTNPPTHAALTAFLSGFLPPSLNPTTQAREVPYLYHTPRDRSHSPTTQLTSRVVFSITPTSGVYDALQAPSPRYKTPICFLHRPFNLDRRRVRRGALVLASHKSFDECLTVGWNEALAGRLGVDVAGAICIKGYKGDDERKIGLVGRLSRPCQIEEVVEKVRAEFGGAGELFNTDVRNGAETMMPPVETEVGLSPTGAEERSIGVVAIMNAFHADEVERVMVAAHIAGWVKEVTDGQEILYLTGAARQPGIEALAKFGMPAYCVGHVACEEWGIKYLAERTRNQWPGLEVIEVFEEEEPRLPRTTKEDEGRYAVGS